MNFEELRNIIKNVKTRVICPQCRANYDNPDLQILGVSVEKCVVMARCHECECPVILTATFSSHKITHKNKDEVLNAIQGGFVLTELQNPVTTENAEMSNVKIDDVLDVHEFLKDFKGDFSELFNKPL